MLIYKCKQKYTTNKQEEKTMTTNEVMRMIVAEMKRSGKSPEEIAKVEICIQYIGNRNFREKLNDFVFEQTYKK